VGFRELLGGGDYEILSFIVGGFESLTPVCIEDKLADCGANLSGFSVVFIDSDFNVECIGR